MQLPQGATREYYYYYRHITRTLWRGGVLDMHYVGYNIK